MAHLPVVYSWQDLMPERFHKLQREHYDDLKSSEEVIEEDEDTLEVMKSIMEIVSWFTSSASVKCPTHKPGTFLGFYTKK